MNKILLTCFFAMFSSFVHAEEPVPRLTVTGTGKVSAEPDVGYITVGVVTKAKDAQEAADANDADMKKLFASLEKEGIKKEELKTIVYDIREDVQNLKKRDADGNDIYEVRRLGFVVTNNVRVTVCDLKKFGKVLTTVVTQGANSVQGISFGSTQASSRLNEARKLACFNARDKANTLAAGLELKLDKVLSVSENDQGRRPEGAYMTRMSDAPPATISAGSLEFSVDVVVVWQVK